MNDSTERTETIAVHAYINALCKRADRLASRVAEDTLSACATNDRPDETKRPRAAEAFDLIETAHALNRKYGEAGRDERVNVPVSELHRSVKP